MLNRSLQPFIKRNAGMPPQGLFGKRDVWPALLGVVLREGKKHEFALALGKPNDGLGQLQHGEFAGVADVHRACYIARRTHHEEHGLHQVIHETETAGLLPIAVDGYVLAFEGLHNEVAHHAAVVGVHAWPVGVENSHHLNLQLVLAPVVKEKRLGAALAFVITTANAHGIDFAPIALGLGVHFRVSVDLAGTCLKNLCMSSFGKSKHVDGTMHIGLGRLNGVLLVMNGRSRAGEVVDFVSFHIQRKRHVVPHQLEAGVVHQVGDVLLAAREEVVHTQHVVTGLNEPVAEVGAQETSTAGDENSFLHIAIILIVCADRARCLWAST